MANSRNKVHLIYSRWEKVFGSRLLDEHLSSILRSDNEFNYLCDNILIFKKSILDIIGDKKEKKEVRYIALYALHLQCEPQYREDLEKIYILFRSGKVDEGFLMSSIWQDDFSLEIIKNAAKDVELKKLLLQIKSNSKISLENKKRILEILTFSFYEKYRTELAEVGEKPYECN